MHGGGPITSQRVPIMEEKLFKAMRHDALQAMDNGEKLLKALAGTTGRPNDAMRDNGLVTSYYGAWCCGI